MFLVFAGSTLALSYVVFFVKGFLDPSGIVFMLTGMLFVRRSERYIFFFFFSFLTHNSLFLLNFSSTEDSKLNGSMWELVRKYIRCSSRTTIGHIKKYLKLKLKLSAVDQVILFKSSRSNLTLKCPTI